MEIENIVNFLISSVPFFLYIVILFVIYRKSKVALLGVIGYGGFICNNYLYRFYVLAGDISYSGVSTWFTVSSLFFYVVIGLMLIATSRANGTISIPFLDPKVNSIRRRTSEESGGYDDSKIKVTATLEEFSQYYLNGLKRNLRSFGRFFYIIGVLFFIGIFVSLIVSLIKMVGTGFLGSIDFLVTTFEFFVVTWLALLCKDFVKLQKQKVENDIYNTIAYRKETTDMTKEILKKAEQKAENNVTINGDNAVFAFDGGSISGVVQTKTISGEGELLKTLALLISYCEEAGSSVATVAAKEMAVEATKEAPDKGELFTLWNKITKELPNITNVVKIANGVKDIFSLGS